MCNMLERGLTPMHTPSELNSMGFHLVTYPLAGLYAATKALSVSGCNGPGLTATVESQGLESVLKARD